MTTPSGNATPSCWYASLPLADAGGMAGLAPLASDVDTDVCIVGAGIAGLTTAYLLTRAGIRVRVLDDGAPAGGESGRTTAHLTCALDDRYSELERLHGEGGAQLVAAIVGGEDHKTGQADDGPLRFARLEAWTRARFPAAGEVLCRWSGQIMEPVDGLAYIGRNPADSDNVFVVTGDSGNGMTHGTIAGVLLSDLLRGHAHPWQELYEPGRVSPRALTAFARENLNVVGQYADWIFGGALASPDSADAMAAGEGALLRQGLHRIAVWRDQQGAVHRLDARCPHLGCAVHWNRTEQTWDCPCHGSRQWSRHQRAGQRRLEAAPMRRSRSLPVRPGAVVAVQGAVPLRIRAAIQLLRRAGQHRPVGIEKEAPGPVRCQCAPGHDERLFADAHEAAGGNHHIGEATATGVEDDFGDGAQRLPARSDDLVAQ